MQKFKDLLLSSSKSLETYCQEVDKAGVGEISNVELKNILLKMNLGLSSKDLNLVIRFCDPANTDKVKYRELLSRLHLTETEKSY
jgi:Ca2+-binding EF-hand superfamily protein